MKTKDRQCGAAMVEFALILPIFLALLIGTIEFSLLFFDKAVLTNASREGARTGSLFRDGGVPAYEINDRVIKYCKGYLITFQDDSVFSDSNIAITMRPHDGTTEMPYDPSVFNSDYVMTVSLTYPYQFLVFPNIKALLGGAPGAPAITLTARTSMQGEGE